MIDKSKHLNAEIDKLIAAGWELLLTEKTEGRDNGNYVACLSFPGGLLMCIVTVIAAGEQPPVVDKVFLEVATLKKALKLAKEV